MKKLITLILTAIMSLACMLGLTACGSSVSVGAQQGTTGYMYASALKGCNALAYETPALAAQDLKNGKISYIVVDKATATSLVNSDPTNLKLIDIALTSEDYAIGVDKNQTALLASINNILTTKSNEIQSILNKTEDELDEINSATKDLNNQAGQLVVATNAEFPPFEKISGEGFKGYDIQIAKLIAQELNLELVIEDMPFDAVVSSIGSNGVDVAMAALTVTAARKTSINFSNPYYKESQVVVTLTSNDSLDEAGTVIDILTVFGAIGA